MLTGAVLRIWLPRHRRLLVVLSVLGLRGMPSGQALPQVRQQPERRGEVQQRRPELPGKHILGGWSCRLYPLPPRDGRRRRVHLVQRGTASALVSVRAVCANGELAYELRIAWVELLVLQLQ